MNNLPQIKISTFNINALAYVKEERYGTHAIHFSYIVQNRSGVTLFTYCISKNKLLDIVECRSKIRKLQKSCPYLKYILVTLDCFL